MAKPDACDSVTANTAGELDSGPLAAASANCTLGGASPSLMVSVFVLGEPSVAFEGVPRSSTTASLGRFTPSSITLTTIVPVVAPGPNRSGLLVAIVYC